MDRVENCALRDEGHLPKSDTQFHRVKNSLRLFGAPHRMVTGVQQSAALLLDRSDPQVHIITPADDKATGVG